MLTIRKEQITMRLFDEVGFVDWYVNEFMPEHLSEFHEALPNEDLEEMIRHGRKEALKYGFDDPESQVHFITLMWEIGPNFYLFSGFNDIANATDQPGKLRIEQFYQVSDEEGAEAMLGADDTFWFSDDDDN